MFKFGVKNKTENESKPQLALLISAGKIKASIWSLSQQSITILGMGEKTYSSEGKEQHLDYKTIRNAVADTIDIACNVAETDVRETTFGIPQSWMENQAISEEYEEVIEKINKELDVEGVAYVSIPHAISFLLQYMHKIPPTTFLVGSTREGAVLSYVEAGKIVENHHIAWSGSRVGENIAKGIKLFRNLAEQPNSVYLYGFGNLLLAKQELEKHNWSVNDQVDGEKPLFVSAPQVYVLDEHVDIYAVSLVGAKDFAKQEGIKGRLLLDVPQIIIATPLDPNTPPKQQTAAPTETVIASEHKIPEQQLSEKITSQIPITPTATHFGFLKNADIAQKIDQEVDSEIEEHTDTQILKGDNFNEIRPHELKSTFSHSQPQHYTSQDLSDEEVEYAVDSKPHRRALGKKPALIMLLILLLVVVGLGVGAVYAYMNIPQTKVTIFVKPDSLNKNIEITARKDAQLSSSDKTIPLQEVKIEVAEKLQADATGTNSVGEKADGTVILYNKTTNERSIKKGTVLKVDNLEFETSADVTIASASASIQGQTNGRAEIDATARQIGDKSNIKKGTTLAVASFARNEVEAEAKNDFTGGNEKQVKVVTARDISSLRQQLQRAIENKVPELVKTKTAAGEILFDKAWQQTDPTYKFNKKAGEESSNFEGEGTASITAYVVKEDDIKSLLSQVSVESVPQGYEKQSDSETIEKEFIALRNGTLTFKASSSITVIPVLNNDQIISQIVGKKEDAARSTILQDTRIFDVSFEHSINLPEFLLSLPQKKQNITIERTVRDVAI